jgi:RNA polymerase sigma-70 factor (ECF subfamily)
MEKRDAIETDLRSGTKAPQTSEANSLRDLDELIEAARTGDEMALNRLLANARPRLLAVALRMVRDRDDAEDVVQEALVKVCRHITRFEGRSAFTTWLHRIVVNAALDCLRRHQSRFERVAGAEADEGPAPLDAVDEETPELLVARAETGAVVRDAIAALTPSHQQVLALREFDGESYQSIAHLARVPVGTVMSRLHHARNRLATELARADVQALCAA